MDTDQDLDKLWVTARVEKIEEDGDIFTYSYRFDSEDRADDGIIQFDWYVIEELIAGINSKILMNMLIDERIKMIQNCRHDRLIEEATDTDLGVLVVLKILANSYLENNTMPNVKEIFNMKILEKIKEMNPEGYEEFMGMIKEETKRLSS